MEAEKHWLDNLSISYQEDWQENDTIQSHRLWHDYIQLKRRGAVMKRPIADILIAGFALRFQGIITSNESDFRSIAPRLKIVTP